MLAKTVQQNIDLWEAWIDLQAPTPLERATLYVIGDVYMSTNWLQPYFIKKNSLLSSPNTLVLDIKGSTQADETFVTEIMYAEELDHLDQYDAIEIYEEGELVKTFYEIERLY